LPVHNFIFQHSRRHCSNIYLVLEPTSVSPSHRSLSPALWTASWLLLAPHHRRRTFRIVVKTPCFISSHNWVQKLILPVRSAWETSARNPSVSFVWPNAPRIWRDFGSALSFQTRLTQTKPVLRLSNEHGSQVKDQGRRHCCHNKHKKISLSAYTWCIFTFRTHLVPLLSVQWINSWWWTEELSETCRVSCRSKFWKLVHLVGFIIRKGNEY